LGLALPAGEWHRESSSAPARGTRTWRPATLGDSTIVPSPCSQAYLSVTTWALWMLLVVAI
jgi:hypothetical protein